MRSIKLLAALAVPAMFAACTNEEIVVDTPLKMQDVVGAELVGTDISLNVTKDGVSSRLTGAGKWESTDKLGLGWIVYEGPSTTQAKQSSPSLNKLYANNLFEVEDESGKFKTKGNIYKGWHFAYFPYAYEEEVTDNKIIDINPAITDENRLNQAFYISARKFLSKDSLDTDHQLSGKPFSVENAVNTIWIQTKPEANSAFEAGGTLDSLTIESITINVGSKVFTDSIKLQPMYLPADTTTTESNFNLKNKLLNSLYAATNPVMANAKSELETNLVTQIDNDNFVTSATNVIAAYTVPGSATLTKENISIVVEVAGGKFTIDYTPNAEEESCEAINNKAIEALVTAYAANGGMTKVQGSAALDLRLCSDDFTTDFDTISDYEEWVAAVAMVNALERTTETFKIDGTIEFPADTLELPKNCVLTVQRATNSDANKWKESFTINGNLESWPAGLVADVNLKIAEGASIADATGINARTIYNYGTLTVPNGTKDAVKVLAKNRDSYQVKNFGTIQLGAYAKAANVNNDGGRIEVVYGSYVEFNKNAAGKGTVAYNVVGDEPMWMINNLVADDNKEGNALVNTLVINKTELDLNKKDKDTTGSYDPYTGSVAGSTGSTLADLSDVTVELYNGSIVGAKGANQNVGTVKALKIEDETSTESWISEVFPAKVEVAEGAILNIGSTEYKTLYTEAEVVNKGTLKVNVTTYVKSVNNSGLIEIADGCTLYYGTQGSAGKLDGAYYPGNAATAAAEEFIAAIESAEEGATVTLNGNAVLSEALTIEKDITIDLNGKTLTTSTVSTVADDITVTGELTVKNGTIKTANTAFYANGGTLTLENCDMSTSYGGCNVVNVTNGTLTIEGGSYTSVKNENSHDVAYTIAVVGNSTATINTTVSGGNGGVTVLGGNVTFTGGSYSSVKACGLYVNTGSATYGDNVTFSGVEGNVVVGEYGGTVNNQSYTSYEVIQ